MFRTHTPTLRKPLRISGRDAEWRHLAGFAAGSGPRIALVAGRRRQGKTLLLDALARATGGLHLAVPQATGTEALRLLADEVGAWTGEPVTLPAGWEAFLSRLVGLSHKEIASVMERTESSTRNLLYRALAELAEAMRTPRR